MDYLEKLLAVEKEQDLSLWEVAAESLRQGSRGRLPEEITLTAPGTPARVAVYVQRARRGESLFHPGDVRLPLRHAAPSAIRSLLPHRVVFTREKSDDCPPSWDNVIRALEEDR